MDARDFAGLTMEQLVKQRMKDMKVSLSLVCPRKLPFFNHLYEMAGGDLAKAKEVNFAVDPLHTVLLNGFQLQERSIIPQKAPSPVDTTASPAAPPVQQQQTSFLT